MTTLDQALDRWHQKFDRCQGVTPAMYDEALGYLRASADRGGSPWNALAYQEATMEVARLLTNRNCCLEP